MMGILNMDARLDRFVDALKEMQHQLIQVNTNLGRIVELLEEQGEPCDLEECAHEFESALLASTCLPTEEEEAKCGGSCDCCHWVEGNDG